MSMYGDDEHGRDKESLYYEILDYIENYSVSDLLELVAHAVSQVESNKVT